MAKNRILYLIAVIASFVFYVAYEEWISWIIFLAVLMLPWLSLALSLRSILRMRIKLEVAERIAQGAEANVTVTACFPKGCPPYRYKIKITKPITGEKWIVRPGDTLPAEHCGGLTVSTTCTTVYDYLGIFRFKVRQAPSAIVRVMPKSLKLPIPEEFKGVLARSLRVKHGGGFSEDHEIRPYRPGDTLNLIHWKLSEKTGELMLREPMEPDQGIALLTLDINGTPEELDRKFSRLLCYGNYLLKHGITFEVLALTEKGIESRIIREETEWQSCIDLLLCAPFAKKGTVSEHKFKAYLHYHVGGEPYEA
ncbi:MAG: DUF58 domain-containing protein [Ruminococcaceae bacterium]|nr:DUF58 domain-containing protein [Oscillospiraceae bacterium]